MLRTTPLRRDSYSRLILSVIIRFYQRCSDRFYSIVSHVNPESAEDRLLISAKWAQRKDLNSGLNRLFQVFETLLIIIRIVSCVFVKCQDGETTTLCQEENVAEMGLLGENTVPKEELLGSMHDLSFLAGLYRSIVRTSLIFTSFCWFLTPGC